MGVDSLPKLAGSAKLPPFTQASVRTKDNRVRVRLHRIESKIPGSPVYLYGIRVGCRENRLKGEVEMLQTRLQSVSCARESRGAAVVLG